MVTCKNCKSINVNIQNLDFARAMSEGSSAVKYTGPHNDFYCQDCETQWQSGPQDWEPYYEYQDLVSKTEMFAHNMSPSGKYQTQEVGSFADFEKREILAKELVSSYKHLLDLEAGIWFDIEKDTKLS